MIPALLDVLTIFFLVAGGMLLWLNLREWCRPKSRAIREARPSGQSDARVKAKPLDLPSDVARGFVIAMNEYFVEQDPLIRNAIATEQLYVLKRYQDPRNEPLRLSDVKNMFAAMRDVVDDG